MTTTLVLLAAATLAASPPTAPRFDAADSLAASERAFAAMAAREGTRQAFLHWFADDGVIFGPAPTNAKQAVGGWPASKNRLLWEPSFVEASGAGDLGISLGPSETRGPDGATLRHGHFVSVWRREEGEPWRVALDLGVSHGKPEHGVGSGRLAFGPRHRVTPRPARRGGLSVGGGLWSGGFGVGVGVGPGTLESENDARHREMAHEVHRLMSAERSYAFEIRKAGVRAALLAQAAEDLRFFRDGAQPSLGLDAAAAAQANRGRWVTFLPRGSRVAASRDLGYSYGLVETRAKSGAKPDTSAYLHVWRKDEKGDWKLAVDAENAL